METFKCTCFDCGFHYEITYDGEKFEVPECCAYCGSSNNLETIKD